MKLIIDTLAKTPQFWLETNDRSFSSLEYKLDKDSLEETLKQIFISNSLEPKNLKLVAFNRGPGSFTGIKTGSVIAGAISLFGSEIKAFTTFDLMEIYLGRRLNNNEVFALNAYQGDYFIAKKTSDWQIEIINEANLNYQTIYYLGDLRFKKDNFILLKEKTQDSLLQIFKGNYLNNAIKPLYIKKSFAEVNSTG